MALPPRSLVGTLAMALLLAMSSLATAQSSTVLSRDGSVVLINKDVNGERWAITYDPDRGYVSGNVLLGNGGVDFIDCVITRDVAPSVDLSCYGAADGWVYLGSVTLSRNFLGNWPIGGNVGATPVPTPRPTPRPEPVSCLNIRGLHKVTGTGTILGSCSGTETFFQQTGCRVSADFFFFGRRVQLSAAIGDFGLTGGTLTVTGLGGGTPRVLTLEGQGLTRQPVCGNPSGNRYLAFDYYGGTDSGRGYIEIPLPGSASAAFLDTPSSLFD